MIIQWSFLLTFLFLLVDTSSGNALNYGPCNFLDTVNITGGWQDMNNNFHFDGLVFRHGTYAEYDYIFINLTDRVQTAKHIRGCICDYRPCIRTCCTLDDSSDLKKNCIKTDVLQNVPVEDGDSKNISIYTKEYGVLMGKPCVEMYKLEPQDYDYDKWVLLKNGSIDVEESNVIAKTDEYCFAQTELESGEMLTEVLLCYHSNIDPRLTLYPIGMLLSIPFLIITFCVYAFIPELRNLHGKCLMCYVASLTVLYVSLSAVQLDSNYVIIESFLCKFIGYAIYMSVLLCFFWLNVMCYDIWSTFNRGISQGRGSDIKRFVIYCLYAFGSSFVLTFIVYIIDAQELFDEKYRPLIGVKRCWMQNQRLVEAIYVYTPITIIMIINIVLYSVTAYKIWRVQKETSVIRNGDSQKHSKMEADTDRFFLYLRLFIIMGATWCMESISWVFDNSIVFYVSDILNCLQGVIIFFLFVWKPKVKKLVVRRYRSIRKLPPVTSQNISSSNRTETSRISSDVHSSTGNKLSLSEKPMLKG